MSILHWQSDFYQSILDTALCSHLPEYSALIQKWSESTHHADQQKWQKQVQQLPQIITDTVAFKECITIGDPTELSDGQKDRLQAVLKNFMPWRKGPFELFGVHIDTEWRSDFKWQRIKHSLPQLQGANVLDVGCGSGYHLFRMHESGANQVIGIDPTTLFFYQFHCFKQYLPEHNIHYLPVALEALPASHYFDVVFSMGVLYHRPDPLKFLQELKAQLKPGGHLVLETLIIEGSDQEVLMPESRYAQMRNVYFIPSAQMLMRWLRRLKFKDIQLIEQNHTSIDEQRSTEWMPNHSLANFLNPENRQQTVEGYPAPLRATIIAQR